MMTEYILLGVVAWALALVTWLVLRANSDSQRILTCIMALTNKEAAAVSASVDRMRDAPKPSRESIDARKKAMNDKQKKNEVLEKVNAEGLMTEQDERLLEEISRRE